MLSIRADYTVFGFFKIRWKLCQIIFYMWQIITFLMIVGMISICRLEWNLCISYTRWIIYELLCFVISNIILHHVLQYTRTPTCFLHIWTRLMQVKPMPTLRGRRNETVIGLIKYSTQKMATHEQSVRKVNKMLGVCFMPFFFALNANRFLWGTLSEFYV